MNGAVLPSTLLRVTADGVVSAGRGRETMRGLCNTHHRLRKCELGRAVNGAGG